MYKIGNGFDSHELVKERKFILGGVEIPFSLGFRAHSDGDVLTHSIIDALCGACGLPDIGQLFPDTDPSFKDISSLLLLKTVMNKIKIKNYRIINLDNIIICEEPKLNIHVNRIKNKLCPILEIADDCISIKPKTAEGTGLFLTTRGVIVYSVVLTENSM